INSGSITGGTVVGTPEANPQSVTVNIGNLNPGETRDVVFEQYYPAPDGDASACASAPTWFGNGANSYGITFDYENSCAPVTSAGSVAGELVYNYEGMHTGEVDIVSGSDFEA